jgi:hypothetical protein
MKREQMIHFIKEKDPYYMFVNFEKYSQEQLLELKSRIEKKNSCGGNKYQNQIKGFN